MTKMSLLANCCSIKQYKKRTKFWVVTLALIIFPQQHIPLRFITYLLTNHTFIVFTFTHSYTV